MDKPIDNDAKLLESPSEKGLHVAEDNESPYDESMAVEDHVELGQAPARKRRALMCFDCNRPEGHFLVSGQRWFFSFLLGLTFGGILLVGPYKCQCCGSSRLMYYEMLNPRFWVRTISQRNTLKNQKRPRYKSRF